MMRYLYIAVNVLLLVLVVVFAIQNLSMVTVSFLGVSLTLPVALLVVLVYILGMVSGSAVFGFVRAAIQRARQVPQEPAGGK
jgi:putative membrane protein